MVSLSSCEAELHSIVSSMSDTIFIRRCLEFMLQSAILQVHYADSSSARQLVSRQGCGKVRHLSGKILWVQDKIYSGEVLMVQVPTSSNVGDIGTKPLSKRRVLALMGEAWMMFVESHEPVGEAERSELQTYGTTSRSMSKLAETILRLIFLIGLEPGTAHGQEKHCRTDGQDVGKLTFWTNVLLLMFVFSWMVFGLTAIWFWRQLDRRLHWNELQQAQTETFMGAERERVNDVQRHVQRVDNDMWSFMDWNMNEMSMIEDSIDTVRFGLVEIGGLVCHSEPSREQGNQMMIQGRDNMLIHDRSQRAPDTTDVLPSSSAAAPSSSMPGSTSTALLPSSAATQAALPPGNRMRDEEAEEEFPTDDDMGGADETPADEGPLGNLMRKMRSLQNGALATEKFDDAAEMQAAILAVLEATALGEGLTAATLRSVQACFQRWYRRNRNRGHTAAAEVYNGYAGIFNLCWSEFQIQFFHR